MDANPNNASGMNMNTTRTIVDFEQSLVDLWTQHLGYVPNYPVSWGEHVRPLIEGMDYVIPEGGLDYLAKTGLLVAPGPEAWQPDDVVHLIGACETLRWFREAPDSSHWPKFNKYQRGRIVAQANGTFPGLADNLKKFTFRHLLLMLLDARTPDQVQQCFASFETKMIAEGIE